MATEKGPSGAPNAFRPEERMEGGKRTARGGLATPRETDHHENEKGGQGTSKNRQRKCRRTRKTSWESVQ